MAENPTRHAVVRCPNNHTFQVETVASDAVVVEYFVCPLCSTKFTSECERSTQVKNQLPPFGLEKTAAPAWARTVIERRLIWLAKRHPKMSPLKRYLWGMRSESDGTQS